MGRGPSTGAGKPAGKGPGHTALNPASPTALLGVCTDPATLRHRHPVLHPGQGGPQCRQLHPLPSRLPQLPIEGNRAVESARESSGGHLGCVAVAGPVHTVPPCPRPHLRGSWDPASEQGQQERSFPGPWKRALFRAELQAAAGVTAGRCQELRGARESEKCFLLV